MKKMLFFFIVLLQINVGSFAQCDKTLEPSSNPDIAYKVRGDRCEGAYSARVAAPSIEIAGLTVGPLAYKLESDEVMKVKNLMESPISIRSSALSIGTYYRMDASLKSKQTLEWSVNDVLLDLRIPAKYLGIYGWIGTEQEKTYLPVKVVSSNSNAGDGKLYLVIRPSTKVIRAKYRYASTGQALGEYEDASLLNAKKAISIVLPENLKGSYNIEIAAMLESGTEWVVKQYKFIK
ncbi:hypothetical protein GZH53_09030 [Flavihumibacter sp. R14]|nr:hypothetical protein [Flavihumibacter soli]